MCTCVCVLMYLPSPDLPPVWCDRKRCVSLMPGVHVGPRTDLLGEILPDQTWRVCGVCVMCVIAPPWCVWSVQCVETSFFDASSEESSLKSATALPIGPNLNMKRSRTTCAVRESGGAEGAPQGRWNGKTSRRFEAQSRFHPGHRCSLVRLSAVIAVCVI